MKENITPKRGTESIFMLLSKEVKLERDERMFRREVNQSRLLEAL